MDPRKTKFGPRLSPIPETARESRILSHAIGENCADEEKEISFPTRMSEGFNDHIFDLVEEYQQKLISMGRELRLEREKNVKLEKEVENYRILYNNLRLSWAMDQAEIRELRSCTNHQSNTARQGDGDRQMSSKNQVDGCRKSKAKTTEHDRTVLRTELPEVSATSGLKTESRRLPKPPTRKVTYTRPYAGKSGRPRTNTLPDIKSKTSAIIQKGDQVKQTRRSLKETSRSCSSPQEVRSLPLVKQETKKTLIPVVCPTIFSRVKPTLLRSRIPVPHFYAITSKTKPSMSSDMKTTSYKRPMVC